MILTVTFEKMTKLMRSEEEPRVDIFSRYTSVRVVMTLALESNVVERLLLFAAVVARLTRLRSHQSTSPLLSSVFYSLKDG